MKRIKIWASKIASSLMAFALALTMVPSSALAIQAFAEESESTKNYVCYNALTFAYYTSLQDAVDDVSSGGSATINVVSDVELDDTLTISGKTIYLQLCGNTISASSSFKSTSGLIQVTGGSDVYIVTGEISGESATCLINISSGSVTLQNVTLSGGTKQAIYVYGKSSSVTLYGCTIENEYIGIETYKCNPSDNSTASVSVNGSTINASYVGIWLLSSVAEVNSSTITGGTHGVVVMGHTGDPGYYTEISMENCTVTGTNSYAIYMGSYETCGSGTMKVDLTGCTVSGKDDVLVYSDLDFSYLGDGNYSVSSVDSSGNDVLVCVVTNDDGDTSYYDAHVLSDRKEATDATCTEDGNIAYYTCSRCGKYFTATEDEDGNVTYTEVSEDNLVIAGTGHDYDYADGTIEWTATEDGYSAVVTVVCQNNETHKLTFEGDEVEITSESIEDGKTLYTATITDDDGNEYTYTMIVDADGEIEEEEQEEKPEKPGKDNKLEEPGKDDELGKPEKEDEPGKDQPKDKPEDEPKEDLPEVKEPEKEPEEEPGKELPELLPEQLPELAPELTPLPDVLPDLPVVPDFEPEEPALPPLPELGQEEPKDEVFPLPELGPEGPKGGLEQPQEQPKEEGSAAPAEPVTYTVTYMVGDTVVSTSTYLEGEMATVEYYYGELVKEYEFVGWQKVNEEGDAFEEILEEGSTFAVNENVTLVAVWSEVQVEEPTEPTESEETEETEESLYPYGQGSTYFDGENESELDGGFDIGV